MADRTLQEPRPGRWRRPASIAGSILIHALVLGYIALRGLSGVEGPRPGAFDDPSFPVVNVWLTPRPMSGGPGGRAPSRPAAPTQAVDSLPATAPSESEGFHLPEEITARGSVPQPGVEPGQSDVAGARPRAAAPNPPARSTPGSSCRGVGLGALSPEAQALCDQRLGDAAARSRSLGARRMTAAETRREARFARDGAAALGAFEERERPLAPNARARPCPPGPSPREECEVSISGRIWSTRDGWFPDLPRPR